MANKRYIILFLLICLAAVTGLGVYYFKNKSAGLLPLKQINSQDCGQAAGRGKDLCLLETALNQVGPEACQKIGDAGLKTDCFINLNLKLAVEKKDLVACQELDNSMLAQTCLERIIKNDFENADCQLLSQKDLAIFCLSEKNGALARKNNNAKLCEKIPEVIKKANCLSELLKIDLHSDNDKDGLDFLKEIVNGANPDNPDTDGDGQPDGVEVKNGYNPDGRGRLNETAANIIKCDNLEDVKLKFICLKEFSGGQFDIAASCNNIKSPELLNYCLKQQQLLFNRSTK